MTQADNFAKDGWLGQTLSGNLAAGDQIIGTATHILEAHINKHEPAKLT